jgi:YidC/Oxa1 family membrane protein insertase
MENDNNRNTIAFVAIALVLVLAYQFFITGPAQKRAEAQRQQAAAAQVQAPAVQVATHLTRDAALAKTPRIQISTPTLQGSISLVGARLDDLFLRQYKASLDKGAPPVELLRPSGAEHAYFVMNGWQGIVGPDSVWTQTAGGVLSVGAPVTLSFTNGGLSFERTIAIDKQYMFTITDTVTNQSAGPVSLVPNGTVQRDDIPPGLGANNIVHEGGIGMLDRVLKEEKYGAWKKKGDERFDAVHGWLGVTDKYWMAALIPPAAETIAADFKVQPVSSVNVYAASYTGAPVTIAAGEARSYSTRLFAGPKVRGLLNSYADVPKFEDAIDWGHLFPLTKLIHSMLDYFHRIAPWKNFGLAIMMLTVAIRLVMFPLANKSYEMGVKMKKLQPQLQELQKKNKDDPAAQQKEMMALYAKEKVNPITGCFPIFLQIPVFYTLTKLFTVTIDMRQAPFFGWIHDLTAPDPSTIWNLFGIIPWDVFHTPWVSAAIALPFVGTIIGTVLHVGVWPLAYGFSLWLSQSMTPQTGIDPTQQMIFKLMPILFTFILAQYAVGLLIYWTWSGLITILQQYIIMRRFKVENPIDDFIGRITGKPQAAG